MYDRCHHSVCIQVFNSIYKGACRRIKLAGFIVETQLAGSAVKLVSTRSLGNICETVESCILFKGKQLGKFQIAAPTDASFGRVCINRGIKPFTGDTRCSIFPTGRENQDTTED